MLPEDAARGNGVTGDAPPPLVPGYTIDDLLGRGGMGTVWRARDLTLHRDVAVKVLREKFAAGSPMGLRFVEEARITSQLQHPGIPAIYRVGELADGRPFLAMKLVKGRTLDAMLAAGEPVNALAVFEAMAQAVGYAHAHGVVHRDLKPANVMVGAFGEVQVMDWGLAKVLGTPSTPLELAALRETRAPTVIQTARDSSSETLAGSVLGTPAFMAPEQAIGMVDKIDPATDVFGLGGILCALLTGRPPYVATDGESERELAARAKLEDAYARLDASGALPELIALAKHCLAPEKTDRPPNAEAVAQRVARLRLDAEERARQAELDRARAEVQAYEQEKRRRVRQNAVKAVMAVLALGVIGTSIGLYRAEQAKDREAARAAAEEAAKIDAAQKAKLAEENLDAAHELTVGLVKVLEQILPSVPETDKLRRNLTDSAAKAMDRFAEQRPDSPVLRQWAGKLARYNANLKRLAGDDAAAEAEYKAALERTKLTGVPEDLAAALRDYATLLIQTGRLAEADRLLIDADKLTNQALKKRPGDHGLLRLGGSILTLRAAVAFNRGRFAESLKQSELAVLALGILPGVDAPGFHPYDPLLRADALRLQFTSLRELKKPDEARAARLRARDELKAIGEFKPGRVHIDDYNAAQVAYEYEATRTWMDDPKSDRREMALKNLASVIQLAENVHQRHPEVPQYKLMLAQAEILRGEVLAKGDKPGDARRDFLSAETRVRDLLKTSPAHPYYLAELGRAGLGLAQLPGGDAKRLQEAHGELVRANTAAPEDVWITRSLVEAKTLTAPDRRPGR